MRLEMGLSLVVLVGGGCNSEKFGGGKVQLCSGAGVYLPAYSAISSGQEMATVSAVSLMANKFPGGGVVAVCCVLCVCALCVCMCV